MNNLLSKSLPNLNIVFSRQTVILFSEVRYKGYPNLRKTYVRFFSDFLTRSIYNEVLSYILKMLIYHIYEISTLLMNNFRSKPLPNLKIVFSGQTVISFSKV